MKRLPPTTLKNYVTRYRTDKELLEKHPENRALLERRIKQHERDIVDYVTSDSFQIQLKYLNLQIGNEFHILQKRQVNKYVDNNWCIVVIGIDKIIWRLIIRYETKEVD